MSVDWVTAPPDPTFELIASGLRSHHGVVLVGPDGVGKTTLARLADQELGPGAWVSGTSSTAAMPFAAFAHLIEVPAVGRTAAVLRSARESLSGLPLLIVDDAHLLDPLSATLVYQLAVGGHPLVVTVAPGAGLPPPVAAVLDDELLFRVEVEPAGHDDARLSAQVDQFVSALDTAARRPLAYLAVLDPMPLDELRALAGEQSVRRARRAGVITTDGRLARPAHPLFCTAVADALGGPELRRLRTEVAERMAGRGDVVSRLRMAVLAADSDYSPPVSELTAAAEDALRLGDLELAERLSGVALQRGAGFPVRLTLGHALGWQGRGREAEAVLAEIDPAELSEPELMAWVLPRAANQFWMLSEPERATAFLRMMRDRVSPGPGRATLDALSATFAMNAGSPVRALRIATEVLAAPSVDDTAVGWAGATAALSCARTGRFSDVDALAERALAAGHPGLLRFTSGFGQTTTLIMTGRPDSARELARELTEYAQLQQPGRAIGEVLEADVLMTTGELDTAVALLKRATVALGPTGYSWGPLAWMLLAQALGRQGQPVAAGKALARAESRHGLKSMLFAPELGLAKAWTLAAHRDSVGAVATARDAVRAAERGGQTAVALRVLRDAVRLGDSRAAEGIIRLKLDCAFGRQALAHAHAAAPSGP